MQVSDSAGNGRGPTKAVVALAAALAFVLGGIGGWVAHSLLGGETSGDVTALPTAEPSGEGDPTPSADATTTDGAGPAGSSESPSPSASPSSPSAPVVERHPAKVTDTDTVGGTHRLTLDYIQFFTGAEASAAAAAHGGEVPPPNDYFIVNDNPLLREFPVQPGITVRAVSVADGTVRPEGYDMTLNDWVAAITGPGAGSFLYSFYWFTITDGTITEIEQQYLP